MEALKQFLKNPWVQGAIGIIAFLVIVPLLLSKVFEVSFGSIGKIIGLQTNEEKEKAKNLVSGAGKSLGYTDSANEDFNRRANAIAKALNTDGFGLLPWEDEEKALKELIGLSKSDYNLVAQFYTSVSTNGRNLTNDLRQYCKEEQLIPFYSIIN